MNQSKDQINTSILKVKFNGILRKDQKRSFLLAVYNGKCGEGDIEIKSKNTFDLATCLDQNGRWNPIHLGEIKGKINPPLDKEQEIEWDEIVNGLNKIMYPPLKSEHKKM